jgi:hypothetical protein
MVDASLWTLSVYELVKGLWSLGPLHRNHAGMFGHPRAGRDGAGIGRALCRIDAQTDDRIGLVRRRHRRHSWRHDRLHYRPLDRLRVLVRYGKYVGLDERRLKVGQYLFLRHGARSFSSDGSLTYYGSLPPRSPVPTV